MPRPVHALPWREILEPDWALPLQGPVRALPRRGGAEPDRALPRWGPVQALPCRGVKPVPLPRLLQALLMCKCGGCRGGGEGVWWSDACGGRGSVGSGGGGRCVDSEGGGKAASRGQP